MCRVSVIVPLYNKRDCIQGTLRSVLDQTFVDFEVIVVDDGSTDESCLLVKELSDSRIKLIRQENGGVSSARNRGLEEANGELIAFIDADDLWTKNHLEIANQALSELTESSWYCAGWQRLMSGENQPVDEVDVLDLRQHDLLNHHQFPLVWTSAIVVRREALQKVGNFPLEYSYGEDRHLWYRLAKVKGSVILSSQTTAFYVVCGDSLTNTCTRPISNQWEYVLDLMRRYDGNSDALLGTLVKRYFVVLSVEGKLAELGLVMIFIKRNFTIVDRAFYWSLEKLKFFPTAWRSRVLGLAIKAKLIKHI